MSEKQFNKAVEILVNAMDELGKTATPAHCEAMAKVADALAHLVDAVKVLR